MVEKFNVEFNQLAIANSEGADDMLNRVMLKDNVGLVAFLKLVPDGRSDKERHLLVSNAHMHWDPEYSDVKLIQAVLKNIAQPSTNFLSNSCIVLALDLGVKIPS